MFLFEDARRERTRRVIRENRNRPLDDDRSRIEIRGDEVDGNAADLYPVLDGLRLSIDTGKRRQQRGVNVENRVGEGVDQRQPDDSHEAGEADEAYVARLQLPHERSLVVVA